MTENNKKKGLLDSYMKSVALFGPAGIVAKVAYDHYIRSSDVDSDHVVPAASFERSNNSGVVTPLPPPTKAQLTDMIFTSLLLKAAAVCDGPLTQGEIGNLKEFVDLCRSKFTMPIHFESDHALFRHDIISFSDLRGYYRAIPNVTQDRKDFWVNLVTEMLCEDHHINDAENAFLFSLKMFFKGRKIPEIYKIVQQPYESEEISISYITIDEVAEKYPFTKISKVSGEQFYTPHPSGIKELVSFDYLLEQSFASSKHTELIEVARQAGAKSIQIMSAEKNSQNSAFNVGASGSYSTPAPIKVSASASFSKKGFSEAELKSGISIQFEGNRSHKDSDWLGRTAQQILRESRWLAYDDELTTFVHNCFGENRVMHFELEVDVSDVQQASVSASIAAECHMAEMAGGSAEANFGKSKEQSKLTHVKYVIDFE